MHNRVRTRAAGAAAALLATAAVGATTALAAPPTGTADLSVTKADSVDPATANRPFEYTITVANAGPDAATNVVVTDRLPQELTLLKATPSQGTCTTNGRLVTCDLGTIDAGTSETVVLRVRAPQDAGQVENTAKVTSDATDPNTADNSDTETTKIRAAQPNVPSCHGIPATIVGTNGDDFLKGTKKRDVILARGGDDEIVALAGNDRICAGKGADVVRARAGDDLVYGAGGKDVIRGQGGNDEVRGQRRGDTLRGGNGDDLLVGGPGRDSCRGGGGTDDVRGCER